MLKLSLEAKAFHLIGETPLFCRMGKMIIYKWTDGNDEDFQRFYLKTEEYYSSIVGGIENRKGFIPYNISESITEVLIAYIDDTAVGCAGLKRYSEEDVEIKRVWVNPENRGQHIALDMQRNTVYQCGTWRFSLSGSSNAA